MSMLIVNNLWATLSADVAPGDTSIHLTTGHGARFPALTGGNWLYLTLFDKFNHSEVVKVTAVAGDVLTVVRGQDQTIAQAWTAAGARAEHRETAGFIDALKADLDNVLIAGGYTMTGALTLAGDPDTTDKLMTKGYADAHYLPSTTNYQAPVGFTDFLTQVAGHTIGFGFDGTGMTFGVDGTAQGRLWTTATFNPASYADTGAQMPWYDGGVIETASIYPGNNTSDLPYPYVACGYRTDGFGSQWLQGIRMRNQ